MTKYAISFRITPGLRAIGPGVYDTQARAEAALKKFLKLISFPAHYSPEHIQSMRVDPIECYDNGGPKEPCWKDPVDTERPR